MRMHFPTLLTYTLALVCTLVLSSGCTGDDGRDGPAGPAGTAGTDGVDAIGTGTIQGSVEDEAGGAIAGATLTTTLAIPPVTTDALGDFVLADVPIGAIWLTASASGYAPLEMMVTVAAGTTTQVDIVLTSEAASTGSISGVVRDVAGDPVADAVVTVEGQISGATTAADGSFLVEDIAPGFAFLTVDPASTQHLPGGTRHSAYVAAGDTADVGDIALSGRPSDSATWVGGDTCIACHTALHADIVNGLSGAAHARFVTEGTSHMIYPELWPVPGDKELPLNPAGELLMVQDPVDGDGLVNLALCTQDTASGREYIFKFYPEGTYIADQLDCADLDDGDFNDDGVIDYVIIPVAATIGGEGNWGEGYLDPDHVLPDQHPNFDEGKQRYLARVQDVPVVSEWMTDNGVPVDKAKQDYINYLPVYLMQDGTPTGSVALSPADFGTPKFWQKGPTHWAVPTNTLSRNCAGCHATGLEIAYQDFVDVSHTYKAVVTAFDYVDLNITCERCHGPGSEHVASRDVTDIITPQNLTARASNELCGQCHASHAGKSITPAGVFKPAHNGDYINELGNGFFVPGLYDLENFYTNYNAPTTTNNWQEGPYHTWPDQKHSRAHAQELPELLRSSHANNPYEKLTCSSCHDSHGLRGGPASFVADDFDLSHLGYADNTLCLACHATHGPFGEIGIEDVATLQAFAGRGVTRAGAPFAPEADDIALTRDRVARVVAEHMQDEAGMGGALYTPTDADMPVGSCNSCHMAKIGKLFDLNDDAQYHLALDSFSLSAVAEGNMSSHVFDIVWPGQSAVLRREDPSTGNDYDIMPNSCGKCHSFARISGDLD